MTFILFGSVWMNATDFFILSVSHLFARASLKRIWHSVVFRISRKGYIVCLLAHCHLFFLTISVCSVLWYWTVLQVHSRKSPKKVFFHKINVFFFPRPWYWYQYPAGFTVLQHLSPRPSTLPNNNTPKNWDCLMSSMGTAVFGQVEAILYRVRRELCCASSTLNWFRVTWKQ